MGNISILFGNWGRLPSKTKNKAKRERVQLQLKNCPAQILGLAECEEETEDLLRAPGTARNPPHRTTGSAAVADELAGRSGIQYITIRGREECSILVAARANLARNLECIHWERRHEGDFTGRTKTTSAAYSRCMICRVALDTSVGRFGHHIVVMVVHMHNVLAKGKWMSRLRDFGGWLWYNIKHSRVDVLMGDFNMSFFNVVPELRSRGAVVDLAAWYPWKSAAGEPCADSCGIWFLEKPGE